MFEMILCLGSPGLGYVVGGYVYFLCFDWVMSSGAVDRIVVVIGLLWLSYGDNDMIVMIGLLWFWVYMLEVIDFIVSWIYNGFWWILTVTYVLTDSNMENHWIHIPKGIYIDSDSELFVDYDNTCIILMIFWFLLHPKTLLRSSYKNKFWKYKTLLLLALSDS